MKYLGVDYGTKRIGLALSDDSGKLAFPHKIIESSPRAIEEVFGVIENEDVDEVVLGESKDFRGEDNALMKGVTTFKEELEKKGIKVHLEPEFLTSVEARRDAPKGINTDDSAAALILQRYLDKINNKND
ncbi:MAG: Holliday junction resolvase RuvX [Candidatus Pacebacteria bacterium]|jgi:putative Holliday junction resolvase|nr:Holliday junction resolvase RuvX [bacterium]MDP6528003.1 Holliday junction resolvase RuvX [Candidatus Paceibacterota bacterium]MDP6659739.1 Holliday junction resolvase RuvX [Candidatus Paceibacterota bacterium]|tara:strand:- start:1295 stop:1684 length:390 start_codon:yes stop_codon:yes gene_type:complete